MSEDVYKRQAFKRVLTASVSAFILSAALPLGIAAETFSEDYDYIGGVIPEPDEVFEAHLCDEDGSEAVSYTHLDVYKRQPELCVQHLYIIRSSPDLAILKLKYEETLRSLPLFR